MSLKTGAAFAVLLFSAPVLAQSQPIAERPTPIYSEYGPLPASLVPALLEEAVMLKTRPLRRIELITFDFGTVEPGKSAERTVHFEGARRGTGVEITVPRGANVPGASYTGWVSGRNTVTVRYTNRSNAAQTPGGKQTFRIRLK